LYVRFAEILPSRSRGDASHVLALLAMQRLSVSLSLSLSLSVCLSKRLVWSIDGHAGGHTVPLQYIRAAAAQFGLGSGLVVLGSCDRFCPSSRGL